MVQVTLVDHFGGERTINVRGGLSLMEAAVQNGVETIGGECGGACACATCHVYVDENWSEIIGEPGVVETEMLEMVAHRQLSSRLSCQIKLGDSLDGLRVTTPEKQEAV